MCGRRLERWRRSTMCITRDGMTDGTNERPIISGIVVRGETVSLRDITADAAGNITTQTQQGLDRIDDILQKVGTDTTKLRTLLYESYLVRL